MKYNIDDIILRFIVFANPSKYTLQRLIYFCKILKLNIDVHYRIGVYGIYGDDINTNLDILVMNEAIKEDGKIYKVGSNFRDYFDLDALCIGNSKNEVNINYLLSFIIKNFVIKQII